MDIMDLINIALGVLAAVLFIGGALAGIRRFFAPPSWRDGEGPVIEDEESDPTWKLGRIERALRRIRRWKENP